MQTVGEPRRLDVTRLLREVRSGSTSASDRLMSVIYADLRKIVRGVMASEGQHHALQPAAVVNEAFLGLVQSRQRTGPGKASALVDWQSRAHFLAVAARQIRLVLSDYARRKSWAKARLRLAISLDDPFLLGEERTHDFATIDQLITTSAETNPLVAHVLEMCCFGGMTEREIALVEHSSTAKVKRDRELARSWLTGSMSSDLVKLAARATGDGSF